MGMDVYGRAPFTSTGEYFRNNVWFWNPLWTYVVQNYRDILPGDPDLGFYNDGYSLDKKQAFTLGANLLHDYQNGKLAEYEQEFNKKKAEAELVPCTFCDATGIRSDDIGRAHGLPDKELDPLVAMLVGRTHGTCNACHGIGRHEDHITSYAFTRENVYDFAMFLLNCGGMSIH